MMLVGIQFGLYWVSFFVFYHYIERSDISFALLKHHTISSRRDATEFTNKPCPLAAQKSFTFRPSTCRSVQIPTPNRPDAGFDSRMYLHRYPPCHDTRALLHCTVATRPQHQTCPAARNSEVFTTVFDSDPFYYLDGASIAILG